MSVTATPYLDDGDAVLHLGDCLAILPTLPADSIDAIVTDPPYGIRFMGKAWDGADIAGAVEADEAQRADLGPESASRPGRAAPRSASAYGSRSGQAGSYDQSASANRAFGQWCEAWGRECLRVLKPGGHLVAFGSTRTSHRLTAGLEDAGFEIRDAFVWLFGQGFPKSLNVAKAIDDTLFRDWLGDHPAEAAALAAAQRAIRDDDDTRAARAAFDELDAQLRSRAGLDPEVGPLSRHAGRESSHDLGRMNDDGWVGGAPRREYLPASAEAREWQGWQTALKPGHEPVVLARKPIAEPSIARQVMATGTGGINVDACRIEANGRPLLDSTTPGQHVNCYGDGLAGSKAAGKTDLGRWGANVLLSHTPDCREVGTREVPSNSQTADRPSGPETALYGKGLGAVAGSGYGKDGVEVVEAWECSPDCPVGMLDAAAGPAGANAPASGRSLTDPTNGTVAYGGRLGTDKPPAFHNDAGGPSRFFYTAKASAAEREGVTHPTVKPLSLMRWLVRLLTPPGGVVLDPFAGSGTTLRAARDEGFRSIGIEREPEYAAMIAHRLRQLSLFGGAE